PSYMHSFGMTENYIILTEFPLLMNPLRFVTSGKPFIENFQWRPEKGTHFRIIDRYTGELIQTIQTEPFFAFHHVNAFELGNDIVVDIAAYKDANIIREFYLETFLIEQTAFLRQH